MIEAHTSRRDFSTGNDSSKKKRASNLGELRSCNSSAEHPIY